MSREYPCVYYDNEKCKKFSEDGITSYCVLGPCSHETPSNADRIRAMSDEELADKCDKKVRTYDLPKEVREIWMSEKMKLRDAWLKWLQQPCEAVQPITERPDGQS